MFGDYWHEANQCSDNGNDIDDFFGNSQVTDCSGRKQRQKRRPCMPNTPTDFLSLYQVGLGHSTLFALKLGSRSGLTGTSMSLASLNLWLAMGWNVLQVMRILWSQKLCKSHYLLEKKNIFAHLCLSTTSGSDIRKLSNVKYELRYTIFSDKNIIPVLEYCCVVMVSSKVGPRVLQLLLADNGIRKVNGIPYHKIFVLPLALLQDYQVWKI